MKALLRFALVIALTVPGIVFAQASTVSGVVRNETGRPIEYAQVVLDPDGSNRQVRTDRDGRFRILGATPGRRAIRVLFVGYRPYDGTVEVPNGAVVDVEVRLERLVQTLEGVEVTARRSGLYGLVIARDSLLPVPNARIEVIGGRTSDTSDAQGAFNFPNLKPGSYIVRVRHAQFESRNVSIVVPEKGAIELDLVVERGILSRDAHLEQLFREMDQRLHWRGITSAMISREQLKGLPTTGIDASLFGVPEVLKAGFYPAREGWEGACLFVDGIPRTGMTIGDFPIEQIEAIEVYGPPMNRSDPTGTLASRWPRGAQCGFSGGARPAFSSGRAGTAPAQLSRSAVRIQFVMIWLRRP